MLVTFKSKAAADIPMYPEHAKLLLAILGKIWSPPDNPRGIITAAEVPAALAKLKSAVDTARSTEKERSAERGDDDRDGDRPMPVGLAQRAFPLVDMLERAEKEGRDVVWGV